MNAALTTMSVRHLWREYRLARSFWLTVLLGTMGLQVLLIVASVFWAQKLHAGPLWSLALGAPVLYLLGIASTVYSREHETQLFAYVRAIPANHVPLWLGKLGFALASTFTLTALLSAFTAALCLPQFIDVDIQMEWRQFLFGSTVWLLGLVYVAGIGTFFSQLVKRPLRSTLYTGVTLGCVLFALPTILDVRLGLIAFGALALVLLPLTLPTTRLWLGENGWSLQLPLPAWQGRSRISGYERASSFRVELHRLVWAAWRQVGLVWIAVFAAVFAGAVVWFFRAHLLANANLELVLVLAVAYAWPVLLGGLLFVPEQVGARRRFFQERGVCAKRLWWQRQLLGLIVLATPLAIAWLVTGMEPRDWSARLTAEIRQAYLSYCVVAYAAAQMCSLFVSSLLVSLASSALLATAVGLWCAFAGRLGLPIWLAAGIPAAGLWTASRLRAPSWLLEWDKPRHWLPSVATLGVAACALVSAFMLFRIYEIPKVSPGFDVEAFAQRAAEQFVPQAAFTIQRRCEQISSVADDRGFPYGIDMRAVQALDQPAIKWEHVPLPISAAESSWLGEHEGLLDAQLRAALGEAHGLLPVENRDLVSLTSASRTDRLGDLFIARARQQQVDADFDGAWQTYRDALRLCSQLRRNSWYTDWMVAGTQERLVLTNLLFWAADPRQKVDRVGEAITWLESYWREQPPWETAIQTQYVMLRTLIQGLPEPIEQTSLSLPVPRLTNAFRYLPGERARTVRLLDVLTGQSGGTSAVPITRYRGEEAFAMSALDMVRDARQRLESGAGYAAAASPPRSESTSPNSVRDWPQTTFFFSESSFDPRLAAQIVTDSMSFLERPRRATRIQLMLVAHRLEHGQYPLPTSDGHLPSFVLERLANNEDGSVKGGTPRALIPAAVDPLTGQEFQYVEFPFAEEPNAFFGPDEEEGFGAAGGYGAEFGGGYAAAYDEKEMLERAQQQRERWLAANPHVKEMFPDPDAALSWQPNVSHLVEVTGPLGVFVADASGQLVLMTSDRVNFPLPTFRPLVRSESARSRRVGQAADSDQ